MTIDPDLESYLKQRAAKLAEYYRKPWYVRRWEEACSPPLTPLLPAGEMPRTVRVQAGGETLIPAEALA